jgi:hypothetical protein
MGDVAPAQGRASDELGVNQLPPRRRHTFLHGRYTWNDVRCQPPYSEVPFYFGEDLEWVARQRGWRIVTLSPTGGATARIGQRLRSRLRHEPTHGICAGQHSKILICRASIYQAPTSKERPLALAAGSTAQISSTPIYAVPASEP